MCPKNIDLLSNEWAETVHQTVVDQLRNTYDDLNVSIDENGMLNKTLLCSTKN